jgi:hypothetical protein
MSCPQQYRSNGGQARGGLIQLKNGAKLLHILSQSQIDLWTTSLVRTMPSKMLSPFLLQQASPSPTPVAREYQIAQYAALYRLIKPRRGRYSHFVRYCSAKRHAGAGILRWLSPEGRRILKNPLHIGYFRRSLVLCIRK